MNLTRKLLLAAVLATFAGAFAAQAADEKPAVENATAEKAVAPKTTKKVKRHDHSQFHKAGAPTPEKAAADADKAKDEPPKDDTKKHVHSRDR